MGTSAARWGMELVPVDERQTDATMWIEVDLAGIMRAAPGLVRGSIQRVSDREMTAIKAAVESPVESAARQGAAASSMGSPAVRPRRSRDPGARR
jgi:hypothetical protein